MPEHASDLRELLQRAALRNRLRLGSCSTGTMTGYDE